MLKRYSSNERGSIATITAIGATCLLMVAGVAIEFSSLTQEKDRLQDVADGAVLAAATSGETQTEKLKEVATAAAAANFDGDFLLGLQKTDNDLFVEVSSDYEMIIMGMFGHKTQALSVRAGSQNGTGGKVNIALALDTTLSMEGARMAAMIDAASDLVEKVQEADNGRGNAKIGIVPFADYVRIDTGFGGEEWIDVQPTHDVTWDSVDEANSVNCHQVGSGESARTECDSYVYQTNTGTAYWNGCMVSRPGGQHKLAAYDGSPYKGNAGHTSCDYHYNTISPLSGDFKQIEEGIEALQPGGKTYLPAGLLWAWRSLEEEGLFTDDDIEEDTAVQRVLLLMTDGSNTASLNEESRDDSWDGLYHWGSSDEEQNREEADALTVEMCESIKAAGIRLITVAYEVEDNDTKNMLKLCASEGADFYDATNATKLKQAFGNIGSGFSKVRLTL